MTLRSIPTRHPVRTAVAAGLLALAAACASTPPPNGQVAATVAAIAHAAGAGADEFAPQEMRNARDKLQRANVAMTARDYPSALSLSREGQVDAQLAEARAESIKAGRAAASAREANRVLGEEIRRKAP